MHTRTRIAITGAAGGMGRLTLAHAPADLDLLALDMRPVPDFTGDSRILDLRDRGAVSAAIAGCDAVIHLGAIPSPLRHDPHAVFDTNVTGTWNVASACQDHGIRRLVFASSICWYGYSYARDFHCPPRLPLDENAADVTEDVYGMSKRVGEEILAAWARLTGSQAVSLRFPMICYPRGISHRPDLPAPAESQMLAKAFFGWLSGDDAARICWRALDLAARLAPGSHEALLPSADSHCATATSAELLATVYRDAHADVPTALSALGPRHTLIDNRKTKRLLGFTPDPAWWLTPDGALKA